MEWQVDETESQWNLELVSDQVNETESLLNDKLMK